MNKEIRKICIILAMLIVLEIPVFWLISRYSDEVQLPLSLQGSRETVPAETAPLPVQTTAPVETTAPETEPAETVPPTTLPAKVTIDTVPQYFQNDYPEEPYLTGTVELHGSSMTALAIVASYMTDHAYYPDEMADYLAHFMGANYRRLEYGNELLQLSCRRAKDINEAIQGVKDGKIVIVMLNGENTFTWREHYVVLTGMNEEGRIELLDTDSANYEKDWLKDCYENGFSKGDLLRGYSCAWIYDKEAMPEEPFLYEPEPPAEVCRYPDLVLTDADKLLIAQLICMEAASEPFEGQQAVAEVVLNRLASGRFQSSVHNVIHAPGQFASVSRLHKAEPDYTQYKAIEQAQYGPYVLDEDVVFFGKFKMNDNFWGQIGSHYFCYSY